MRIFFAGATGVIGRVAVPRLLLAGHAVAAVTRHADKVPGLTRVGVDARVLDVRDLNALTAAVHDMKPDVVVNMLTDLSTPPSFRTLDRSLRSTNWLRTRVTDVLLRAAEQVGARRYIGQGFAGWFTDPTGGAVTQERVPFLKAPPRAARRTTAALEYLERQVRNQEGLATTVLRFGPLYGPGTSMGAGGHVLRNVENMRTPIVGSGSGVWSFTHVEDAGRAVRFAVEHDALEGVFSVVDDDPAPVSEWLPHLAEAVGAAAPRRVAPWLARPIVGGFGLHVMTEAAGASNAAVRSQGFELERPSWREGFRTGLGL